MAAQVPRRLWQIRYLLAVPIVLNAVPALAGTAVANVTAKLIASQPIVTKSATDLILDAPSGTITVNLENGQAPVSMRLTVDHDDPDSGGIIFSVSAPTREALELSMAALARGDLPATVSGSLFTQAWQAESGSGLNVNLTILNVDFGAGVGAKITALVTFD